MKATGIVRRIDDLGRVVIPKEIRRTLHLREGDPLEIYTDNQAVCFKKYSLMADCVPMVTACVETLRKKGVECTLYDNSDCKLCGDKTAPAEMEYDRFNPNHFAINVDGEFCGYLAVASEITSNQPLIELTVSVLARMMALD